MTEHFTCAGCGAVRRETGAAGLWIPPGEPRSRAVPYLLCRACAAAMRDDPERMVSIVEARLMQPQGHA